MAIYRYAQDFVRRAGRKKPGGTRTRSESAVAKAAYNARENISDERLGKTQLYARHKDNDLIHAEIIAPHRSPDWARTRATLWNKAEAAEGKKNSQPAMTVDVALPRELSDQQNVGMVKDFIQKQYTSKGIIADFAIHKPLAKDGGDNPHAHILLTTRKIDGDGFGSHKTREWQKPAQLNRWRESWATVQNEHLEKHGITARVDHRTLKEQGIDRIPGKHLGKEAQALERKGKKTRRGHDNRLVDHKNTVNETTRSLVPAEVFSMEIYQPTEPDREDADVPDTWPDTRFGRHIQMLQDTVRNTAFLSEEQQIGRFSRFNAVIRESIEKTVDSARGVRDKLLAKYTRFTEKEGEDINHEFER